LLTFPLFFDGSVTVMFATLARGARLVLPDPSPVLDPAALCRTIARARITHTLMVPSLHGALLEAATPGEFASLTTCSVAGEACEGQLVRRHLADLPNAALVNEYGPTEATVWATSHRCVAADAESGTPIGRAIDGVRIHLLDAHLRPVPAGAAGEIFIGGRGVAWGYVGNPALTAEKFLPDPWSAEPGARMYRTGDRAVRRADGNLLFLGRTDHQIKLRGYRIEPGEIEAALCAEPGIAEAVVLVRGTPEAGERLVAYVTGRPGQPIPGAAALQSAVAAKLPSYMVPTVVVLPAFPRLPSGKLDRRALPEPVEGPADHGPAPEPGDAVARGARPQRGFRHQQFLRSRRHLPARHAPRRPGEGEAGQPDRALRPLPPSDCPSTGAICCRRSPGHRSQRRPDRAADAAARGGRARNGRLTCPTRVSSSSRPPATPDLFPSARSASM
jgi:acyl-coenzyme A synthetase/AMP-(fatty) acid ligase